MHTIIKFIKKKVFFFNLLIPIVLRIVLLINFKLLQWLMNININRNAE